MIKNNTIRKNKRNPNVFLNYEAKRMKIPKNFRDYKSCCHGNRKQSSLVLCMSSIICLGPTGAGKTLLLKKLKNKDTVDETSCTIPTTGSNLTRLRFLNKETGTLKEYEVRELGGAMAPIWHKYYGGVNKVIYVVDASNLCQISAAGILLFSILADPQLLYSKVLIVLTKMDVSYRQMRNEALLMLQMKRLQKEVPQSVTILESSAVSGEGVENIAKWIQGKLPNNSKVLLK